MLLEEVPWWRDDRVGRSELMREMEQAYASIRQLWPDEELPHGGRSFLALQCGLKHDPSRTGVLLIALILATYNSLFRHLLVEVEQVQEIKIQAVEIIFGPPPEVRQQVKNQAKAARVDEGSP